MRVLLIVVWLVPAAFAQIRPSVPLVFDDFTYGTRDALLAPARWVSDLEASMPGDACTPGEGCERLWYLGNWRDEGAGGARVTTDGPSSVRLQTLPGDTIRWGASEGHPPLLQSGLMASTGTWVAAVRFSDIRHQHARTGRPGSTSLLSDAFWTISPHYVSNTAAFDRAHWSELNHEWNNYFYPPRRVASDLSTGMVIDQFVAAGITLDGECQGLCESGLATGGLFMSDPIDPASGPLTCREWRDGRVGAVRDAFACQEAMTQNVAVLLLQYRGTTMHWSAAVADPRRPGGWLWMALDHPVGRRTQPMTAMFSRIMASPSFCNRTGNPEPMCRASEASGFSIDWFLYTPDPDLTVWDAIGNVEWMRSRGLSRVNTASLRLAAPSPATMGSSQRLLTPATSLPEARPEWTFVPPLPVKSSAGAARLSWDVRWQWRARRSAGSEWSAWTPVEDGGFSIDQPVSENWERVEVEVTARDWHPIEASEPIVICRGLHRDTRTRQLSERVCTAR